MAWETRNGVGHYYTRSKRGDGRVVREYIGTGPLAELIAAQDAERRAERERKRQSWNAERGELEALESAVDRFTDTLSQLTSLLLVNAGYYRHHRGRWRKCRDRCEITQAGEDAE